MTIRVEKLSYAYPGAKQPVLKEINLTIPRGEFVLVAGPSGCGKSTLANAISGLIPSRMPGPMRGKVFLNDSCITTMDIHETSQKIGMVFQNPDNQLIQLDVESEVAFGPENLNLPREEIQRRITESLHYTHTESLVKSPIFALSGGQKQRIAISAALAMNPEVLVLDEPTSDLDPAGTQEVLKVLQKLNRERKMTIILIEHKIDEVIPWVDRVLLMEQGRIIQDAEPREAFRQPDVWEQLGVTIPEMVRLSHKLPDVFSGQIALSVEDAYDALMGSRYQHALLENHHQSIEKIGYAQQKSLLNWQNVGVSFGDKSVLKGLNLSLHSGEWVALAGPNGSGKTTLASLAMGFQAPTDGQVRFMDQPIKKGKISKQASKIGYLFQAADNMLFSGTVLNELKFGKKHNKNHDSFLNNQTIEDTARLIGLDQLLDRNPYHLSHGQRKRLAFGALLTANPDLLILDEPTTGQDEGHAKAFLEFLQNMRHQFQMAYLMITHDMRAAATYASRIVVLNEGKIVLNGTPSQVFACSDTLAAASIVPPPIAKLHGLLTNGQAESVSIDLNSFLKQIGESREEVLI